MGLQERKEAEIFQENDHKTQSELINSIVGKEVEIIVDWDSISEEGSSHLFKSSWTNMYYAPLIKVLSEIAGDDIGKTALKEKLNKITIQNTLQTSNKESAVSFSEGGLIIDHHPTTNIPDCNAFDGEGNMDCREMCDALRQVLNANL